MGTILETDLVVPDPRELTRSDQASVLNTLVNDSLNQYGYMCFDQDGFFSILRGVEAIRPSTPADRVLSEILRDERYVISDAEATSVRESERNVWKVHLNVPPERRAEFVKIVIELQRKSWEALVALRQKVGADGVITADGLIAAGAPIFWIDSWKFRGFSSPAVYDGNGERVPDFVFYAQSLIADPSEVATSIAQGLSPIVREYEGPDTPRFSELCIGPDGHHHMSLSIAQGSGSLKELLKKLKRSELDKWYDRKRGYSRVLDEETGS